MKAIDYAAIRSRADRLRGSETEPRGRRFDADAYKYIPSLEDTYCNTAKRDPLKYTGSVVIGIATTHKSNAVPVSSTEQAIDIARMRR